MINLSKVGPTVFRFTQIQSQIVLLHDFIFSFRLFLSGNEEVMGIKLK